MSPKLKEDRFVVVIPDRIRETAKKNGITITSLAEQCLFTTYRNFCKQLAKGEIKKEWLEIICDKLDVSQKYITGETDNFKFRIEDFYLRDKQLNSLSDLLKYSQMGHYSDRIGELNGTDIENILSLIVAMLDSHDEMYSIVPFDRLDEIHEKVVSECQD